MVLVGIFSGFAGSRSARPMSVRMHIKDLPQHGLRLITPSDPRFDDRLQKEFKGESNEVVDTLRPFSVFFENKGKAPSSRIWCVGALQLQRGETNTLGKLF